MMSFALYRLPWHKECRLIAQKSLIPIAVQRCADIPDVPGFVVAPFMADSAHPLVVIAAEETRMFDSCDAIDASLAKEIDWCAGENVSVCSSSIPADERKSYAMDFRRAHNALTRGDFDKLVLARRKTIECPDHVSVSQLFIKACRRYPRMFVSVFSHPECGTWLVATPETLLEYTHEKCRTMALAGTMPFTSDDDIRWSDKNLKEQDFVAQFIMRTIHPLAESVDVCGPYTARAGNLVHLRSDFDFVPRSGVDLRQLLDALHPTPAVCGLPKHEALRFIIANESAPRDYYSGFCGPVNLSGESRLFVSLRCMRVGASCLDLFAGGGILPDSEEEAEWLETEEKLKTVKALL